MPDPLIFLKEGLRVSPPIRSLHEYHPCRVFLRIPRIPAEPLVKAMNRSGTYQRHMMVRRDPAGEYEPQKKLAVLIDAENAQPEIIEGLLAEIALYRYRERETDLRELDNPEPPAMERGAAELFDPTDAAV